MPAKKPAQTEESSSAKTNTIASSLYGKDCITTTEWSVDEIKSVLDLADFMKKRLKVDRNYNCDILKNRVLYSLFYNTSTRTRTSFQAAMAQMGGITYTMDPKMEMQVSVGEQIKDTANVLSRYGDAVAVRYCFVKEGYGEGNKVLRDYAKYSSIPVVNMECDKWHPCQILADMQVVREKLGTKDLKGKKIVMSWAYGKYIRPTAVAQDMVSLFSRFGCDLVLAHPPEFPLDDQVLDMTRKFTKESGGTFTITNNMKEAFENADVVYPKNWGIIPLFTKPDEMAKISAKHTDWKTTKDMMDLTKKGKGHYLHCLPCDRGLEVDDEVIDGPNSVVYDEAENRLHVQKSVLAHLLLKEIDKSKI